MSTAPHSFSRHWRRVRLVSLIAAAGLLAAFLVGSHRQMILVGPNGLNIGVHDGCFQVGRTDPTFLTPIHPVLGKALGLSVDETWRSGFATAWRPFRAGGASGMRLLVPLWMPLLAAVALAGYAHGALAGHRRGARGSCSHCGYDLTALRKNATGPVKCPECGRSGGTMSA